MEARLLRYAQISLLFDCCRTYYSFSRSALLTPATTLHYDFSMIFFSLPSLSSTTLVTMLSDENNRMAKQKEWKKINRVKEE